MAITVCLAGITGWTGEGVARAILAAKDFELVGAVARKTAGRDIGEIVGDVALGINIAATVAEALVVPADVFVDYTSPSSVKANVLTALNMGVSAVIGTSGLTAADFVDIEEAANKNGVGVISCGNFSVTAALAKRFSLMAAKHLPQWEIIDYAHAGKMDVPSGTVQELAEELSLVKTNKLGLPLDKLHGPKEARGAQIAGTPVHSIRLPSYTIGFETIFGLTGERLTIRHDSGSGAEPYVDGTLLAIRKVMGVKGLIRGLDKLLFDME